jgi:hypothetical protein
MPIFNKKYSSSLFLGTGLNPTMKKGTVYIMLPYIIYVCFGTFLFITQVPLCVQFNHTIGKNIQSKSATGYDGSVFLPNDGHVYEQNKLNPIDPKEHL